jgi:hypothetical protein
MRPADTAPLVVPVDSLLLGAVDLDVGAGQIDRRRHRSSRSQRSGGIAANPWPIVVPIAASTSSTWRHPRRGAASANLEGAGTSATSDSPVRPVTDGSRSPITTRRLPASTLVRERVPFFSAAPALRTARSCWEQRPSSQMGPDPLRSTLDRRLTDSVGPGRNMVTHLHFAPSPRGASNR